MYVQFVEARPKIDKNQRRAQRTKAKALPRLKEEAKRYNQFNVDIGLQARLIFQDQKPGTNQKYQESYNAELASASHD
jgi:hypothetical protein